MAVSFNSGLSGMLGTAGSVIATDNSNIARIGWSDSGNYINVSGAQAQQLYTATATISPQWSYAWADSVGQKMQQAVEPAKKKVMSLLETLREEVSNWHGSLGTI